MSCVALSHPSALTPAPCQPHKMHAHPRKRLPSPAGSGEGLGMRATPAGQPRPTQNLPNFPKNRHHSHQALAKRYQALQALSAQKHFFLRPVRPGNCAATHTPNA